MAHHLHGHGAGGVPQLVERLSTRFATLLAWPDVHEHALADRAPVVSTFGRIRVADARRFAWPATVPLATTWRRNRVASALPWPAGGHGPRGYIFSREDFSPTLHQWGMDRDDTELSRLLAAEARGELNDEEGRALLAMLEARLREVDPAPPPPWDSAWRHLQRRIGRERRVVLLAGSGTAAALAAMVTFAVYGAPHPWVVFGGLGVALLGFAAAGVDAWRRAAQSERISHDDGTTLFTTMRADLDRQIAQLRVGGPALAILLLLAFVALAATVGSSRPSGIAVGSICLVVAALVTREMLVALPRLVRQRRRLD